MPMPAAAARGPAPAGRPWPRAPDSLLLLPPADDILLGLWRAEALVTGDRIHKVTFLVDGKPQLSTTKKPFSAELRLERFPTEQTVRAEGYDAEGKLVAADEVILNQPRGGLERAHRLAVQGAPRSQGKTKARAEVVVPDGRRVKSMDFRVNDEPVASLAVPPWEAEISVPADVDLVYLTVVATLDDGTAAEAVRYLKSPEFVSEVEVNLVELYVAVTDRSNNLVTDLTQADFEVFESQKQQEIVKFELVQNLPLTLGILLDTSGSMAGSMVRHAEGGLRLPRKRHEAQGPRLRRELRPPAEPDHAAHRRRRAR